MLWFTNLPTRAKLFMSFGLIIVFLIIAMAMAYRGISISQRYQKEIGASEFPNAVDIITLRAQQNEMRTSVLTMMMVSSRAEKERLHQEVKSLSEKMDGLMQRLLERARSEPLVLPRVEEIERIRQEYKKTRDSDLIPLIYEGKTEPAKRIAFGIQSERYGKMTSISAGLEKEITDETYRHFAAAGRAEEQAVASFLLAGAVAVLASFFMALFLNSIMARPLKEISVMAESIASGDLTVKPSSIDRRDEVGALAKTFSAMMAKLQKQTRDVLEAVNVLASSSNEIAATTAQLASGTEQTSVAVTETTTTVEEVKHTANASSQKARHVAELSQNAVTVSQTGAKLVNETIEGIGNIREQMEYIAETIVKLSEHNQAIGEIISTVDELAEQSNLLAVNASIEASKAGEHGKGFIVVAQEIKNLAEQSKQATKQVRTILNDIQKASTVAVMATEKGSKAVDLNVKQSSGTGESIRELSKVIGEASQAVMQIAASNQQQLVGMDQVALAMVNIKQAAAQNAASTKQVEITVRNLQELGQRLKRMVEHYRV